MFEGLCYHGNKSTILLLNSIFRTTPEVSSKLYFVEISQVSEKLWLFNHRRADFLASKFWTLFSLLSLLKAFLTGVSLSIQSIVCSSLSKKVSIQSSNCAARSLMAFEVSQTFTLLTATALYVVLVDLSWFVVSILSCR